MSEPTAVCEPCKRYTKEDMESLVSGPNFKEFLKAKCGQCDIPACKRFKGSMPMIVKQMLDTYWCNECGRILCEKHRDQHTCERRDAVKEGLANMSPEKLKERMEAEAARKLAAEEAAKDEKRREAEVIERGIQERKARRKLIAGKSSHVAGFLQQAARDDNRGFRPQVREELFEMYTKANRINLFLWNEYESPTTVQGAIAEEEWEQLKEIYERGCQIIGAVVVVDGERLNMRNPWDPPPPAEAGPQMD
eukprot:gnl/TRDRNA2_/TRDRNA2_201412_c0_seq1.p1 gnl/TRDRNA2_/TRDRNA2_201412_c0~~gnl/TRDRNA2_/TRDRNA2_201412_c0_seq1.p1  ORF type:complete len:250 (-),score=62.06 gnl/TRDRNA2_/TRDRNA2_201412_c0_seq1:56-805(-)